VGAVVYVCTVGSNRRIVYLWIVVVYSGIHSWKGLSATVL